MSKPLTPTQWRNYLLWLVHGERWQAEAKARKESNK